MTTARGMPGTMFAEEIAAQPAALRAVAGGSGIALLREAFADAPVALIGSGSSFCVAQLTARALRRAGVAAWALAASEAADDASPFTAATAIVFSQSGRSADVLDALDRVAARRVVAVTNVVDSPLAQRAHAIVDVGVGVERAVPATKSVTASIALALAAASADADAARAALHDTAGALERWLPESAAMLAAAIRLLDAAAGVVVAGSGDGVAAAAEVALKLKEAAYARAEPVSAGEFRHGGIALLDPATVVVMLERPGDARQRRLGIAARDAGSPVVLLGALPPALGPGVPPAFAAIGWIVTGQALALGLGRARGIDGDAPRGIGKVVG